MTSIPLVYDDTPAPQVAAGERIEADRRARQPVLLFFHSAVVWLLIGSVLGLVASLKFQFPDWLTAQALWTFGRVRAAHLNAVAYGWASMALVGIAVWMVPRLLRAPLQVPVVVTVAAVVWNLFVGFGVVAIVAGWTDGLEWLEIPYPLDVLGVVAVALVASSVLATVARRKAAHFYVSVWYALAALVWFPILFVTANLPIWSGVGQAALNWWYGHNTLGLWITALSLATAYYMIPKVLGRPIRSYWLSLVGFWALAFFYSLNGIHHLIGGPVPTWLVTVSITASVMMVIPVTATAVNFHTTMRGSFGTLRHSPTLAFVVAGAMIYTAVSLQGSTEALRTVNRITHFTHFTVGHAHLGVYGFASMIVFGAMYFIVPRLMDREWPRPALIRWHFWLALVGIAVYFLALTIGGWREGETMLDPAQPFAEVVNVTKPYLVARSVGGTLMLLAHCVFGYHYWLMVRRRGPETVWADGRAAG